MNSEAPDLRDAVIIEQLTAQLRGQSPLSFPLKLGGRRSSWIDLWQLIVDLPIEGDDAYGDVPVDLSPLQALFERHVAHNGRPETRWAYNYFYFEVLYQEHRLEPDLWIAPRSWAIARRTWERSLHHPSAGPHLKPWRQTWEDMLQEGTVQRDSPRNWLDMLRWDADSAEVYEPFDERVYWEKVPVYLGVNAETVRQCMREDLVAVVFSVPDDAADALARWRSWAGRLGLHQRWPTPGEQKLELRRGLVLELLEDGECAADIAEHLIDADLYPVYPNSQDPDEYDDTDRLRNAKSTVHHIINELVEEGEITHDQINRRPVGRPPKSSD